MTIGNLPLHPISTLWYPLLIKNGDKIDVFVNGKLIASPLINPIKLESVLRRIQDATQGFYLNSEICCKIIEIFNRVDSNEIKIEVKFYGSQDVHYQVRHIKG